MNNEFKLFIVHYLITPSILNSKSIASFSSALSLMLPLFNAQPVTHYHLSPIINENGKLLLTLKDGKRQTTIS